MREEQRLALAFFLSFLVILLFQFLFLPRGTPPPPSVEKETETRPQEERKGEETERKEKALLKDLPYPEPFSVGELRSSSPPVTISSSLVEFGVVENRVERIVLKSHRTSVKKESPPVSLCSDPSPCFSFFLSGITYPPEIEGKEESSLRFLWTFPEGKVSIQISLNPPYESKVLFSTTGPRAIPVVAIFPLSPSLHKEKDPLRLKIWEKGSLLTYSWDKLPRPFLYEGNPSYITWDLRYFLLGIFFPEPIPILGKVEKKGSDSPLLVTLPPLTKENPSYTAQLLSLPKELKTLRKMGGSLEKTIDFGWTGFLAFPMASLLHFFFSLFHNYGVSIILLTIFVRLLLFPLTWKGMKSMQDLSRIRPKMEEIQKKYKDDPKKLQEELMKLYREEKVNPLGGCLPLLLQIPFFFALYNVLYVSVELRHAPFILWIRDLTSPDTLFTIHLFDLKIPFCVLPILMGITTFWQQKFSPPPTDPVQKQMMNIMPIFLTIISYLFPSGLTLYWFVSNLFSIAQQWWMKKYLSSS